MKFSEFYYGSLILNVILKRMNKNKNKKTTHNTSKKKLRKLKVMNWMCVYKRIQSKIMF